MEFISNRLLLCSRFLVMLSHWFCRINRRNLYSSLDIVVRFGSYAFEESELELSSILYVLNSSDFKTMFRL